MSAELWMDDLVIAQVAWLNSQSDLTGLCGLIEVGLMLPRQTQDINVAECPYLGVKTVGYTEHLAGVPGSAVGHSVHDVTTRIDIQIRDGQQSSAEKTARKILSQLAITVGIQRRGHPFGVSTSHCRTLDLTPGSGLISMIDDLGDEWIVEAEYVWKTRVRLRISV